MNCEKRGDKRALPKRPSEFPEHKEKQNYGCGMENNIRQMKQARIESVELELEHVRNVLERKPVRGRPMGECPFQIMKRDTAVYFRNFINVFGIVEVNKRELDRLAEDEPNERDQAARNCPDDSAFGNFTGHFANLDRATACAADKDRHLP